MRQSKGEDGAAIVEFIFVVPVLLLFVCALLDIGLYLSELLAVDDAATNACRTVCAMPDTTTDELMSVVRVECPQLADVRGLDVEVEYGGFDGRTYDHRLYATDGSERVRKSSVVMIQPVTVTVTHERNWFTFIGAEISRANGGDGACVASAVASGSIERTSGSTW